MVSQTQGTWRGPEKIGPEIGKFVRTSCAVWPPARARSTLRPSRRPGTSPISPWLPTSGLKAALTSWLSA